MYGSIVSWRTDTEIAWGKHQIKQYLRYDTPAAQICHRFVTGYDFRHFLYHLGKQYDFNYYIEYSVWKNDRRSLIFAFNDFLNLPLTATKRPLKLPISIINCPQCRNQNERGQRPLLLLLHLWGETSLFLPRCSPPKRIFIEHHLLRESAISPTEIY